MKMIIAGSGSMLVRIVQDWLRREYPDAKLITGKYMYGPAQGGKPISTRILLLLDQNRIRIGFNNTTTDTTVRHSIAGGSLSRHGKISIGPCSRPDYFDMLREAIKKSCS